MRRGRVRDRNNAVRLALAIVTIATFVAALAVGGAIAASSAKTHVLRVDTSSLPGVKAESKTVERKQARLRAWRKSPAGRRELARSRTRFKDLSRRSALRAARVSFTQDVERKPWRGPRLHGNERLKGYLDRNTAVVDAGERDAIVSSSFPLLTKTGVPVDMQLVDRSGSLEPDAPLVPLRISRSPKKAAVVGTSDVGVGPAGGRGESASVVADKVFYANVDTDTDLIVEPTLTGVETFTQLRSAASPEDPALDLRLPGGAKLRKAGGDAPAGTLEIVKGGAEPTVRIDPPAAMDADGQPVPVSYRIDGDRIVLDVPHRGGSFRYPILVDPDFNVWEDFRGWPDTNQWESVSNGSWGVGPYNGSPLSNSALGGVGYQAGQYHQYRWPNTSSGLRSVDSRYRDSYIYRADTSVDYTPNGTELQQGFYPDRGFVIGTGTQLGGHTRELCVRDDCFDYPSNGGVNSGGSDGNWFFHSLVASTTAQHYPAQSVLKYAVLYLRDKYAPTVGSTTWTINGQSHDPNRWVAEGTSLTASTPVSDRGLGLREGRLVYRQTGGNVPGANPKLEDCYSLWNPHDTTPDWNGGPWHGQTQPGLDRGDRNRPCPLSSTYTWTVNSTDVNEGQNHFGVDAYDIVSHKADVTNSSYPKVDRSAPGFTNLQWLDTVNGKWVKEGTHGFYVPQATDGHSGVRYEQLLTASQGDKPSSDVARDAFQRSTTGGFGTADRGGPWRIVDPGGTYSTDGQQARITKSTAANPMIDMKSTRALDVNSTVQMTLPPAAGHTLSSWFLARKQPGDWAAPYMGVGLQRNTDGRIFLVGQELGKNWNWKTMFNGVDTGFSEAGALNLRVQMTGTNPTTVKARVWPVGQAEPTSWLVNTSYVPVEPQKPGTVGFWLWHNSLASQTVSLDNFVVRSLDTDTVGEQWVSKDFVDHGCDTLTPACPTTAPQRWHVWYTADYDEGPVKFRVRGTDALGNPDGPASTHLGQRDFTVNLDRGLPQVESAPSPSPPHPSLRPGGVYSFTADTKDNLSGVKKIELFVNDSPTPIQTVQGDACSDAGCEKNPPAKAFSWSPPSNYGSASASLKLVVTDVAGNVSAAHTWTVLVDGTRPTAPVVSGALRDARGKAVKGDAFGLHVEAEDGSGSGVKQIKLFAGTDIANLAERIPGPVQGPTADGKQTWNTTFNRQAGDESRTPRLLRVQVQDQAGNTSADPPAYPSRVSEWRLHETPTTNTLARDSVGTNHGSYNNVTGGTPGARTDGDNAVTIGSGGRVDMGNPASLQLANGTVEAWIRTSNPGSGHRGIVTKRLAYGLFLENGVLVTYDWGGNANRSTGVNLADGQWHHVAMTFRSGVANGTVLYVDGVPRLTTQLTVSGQSLPFQIGSEATVGTSFGGSIDDVSVYSTALDPIEVARLAKPEPTDWRRAHWRLGETALVDPFDTLDAWTYDLGSGTLDAQGGQLVPTDTSEKVLRADGNYTDAQGTLAFRTGATMPSSAIGFVLRRRDSSNWVHGFVNPTGALSFWKKDNGNWSALSTQGRPVLAPNTNYWVRVEARGNVLTAWLYTADPAGGAAPVTTVTHTLTGADATKFGAGVSVPAGFRIQGVPTDYRYESVRLDPLTATASQGSDHGTYTGKVTLGEPGAPGADGPAALFEGGFVDVGNPASLQLADGTVEAWVKTSNPGSGHRGIVTKRLAYGLFLENGVLVTYDWGGGANRSTGVNLADGQWHHVAMTFRSGVANGTVLYVDGTPRLTTQLTVSSQVHPVHIASEAAQSGTLNGTIDEAAVYPGPLSAAEVSQLYSQRVYDWKVVFDNTAPVLDEPTHVGSISGWRDGSGSLRTQLTGHDTVSGVKSLKVLTPKQGGDDVWTRDDRSCSSSIENLCPLDPGARTVTYGLGQMPEGSNTVRAFAQDAATNDSGQRSWPIKVDRSDPSRVELSGELPDDPNHVVGNDVYGMTISADDAFSGVESVSYKITPVLEPTNVVAQGSDTNEDCTADQCPTTFSADFDVDTTGFSDREYELTATAEDQLNHPKSTTMRFTVDHSVLSAEQARAQIAAEFPNVVAASTEANVDDGLFTPGIASPAADGMYSSSDALRESTLGAQYASGLTFSEDLAKVGMTPNAVGPDVTPALIANDSAAVYANSHPATDTVVRPTGGGIETFMHVRSIAAPLTMSWNVALKDGQELRALANGNIAVVEATPLMRDEQSEPDPATEEDGTPDESEDPANEDFTDGNPWPVTEDGALEDDVDEVVDTVTELAPVDVPILDVPGATSEPNNTAGQIERETAAHAQAQQEVGDDETVRAVFLAPTANDSNGLSVPVSMSASGSTLTITLLHRTGTFAYPILVDPEAAAGADDGGAGEEIEAANHASFKLMTWNIANNKGGDPRNMQRLGRFAKIIRHQKISVALIQEMCGEGAYKRLRDLLKSEGMGVNSYFVAEKIEPGSKKRHECADGNKEGVAIMVRTGHRLRNRDAYTFKGRANEHDFRRVIQGASMTIGGRNLRVYNTHLSHINAEYRPGLSWRAYQIAVVGRIAGRQSGATIVGGDWNENPNSSKFNRIKDDGFSLLGPGKNPGPCDVVSTFYTNPNACIDHLWGDIHVDNIGAADIINTIADPPSDHRPVKLRVGYTNP